MSNVQAPARFSTGSRAARAWALALGLPLTLTQTGWAQPPADDRNLAQVLFNQGRDLMALGEYREACPKFAESQRLDPGGGTLLNLALCHEREGKVATAWADFHEALSAALRDRRAERAQLARSHIALLEPRLPGLTLKVDESGSTELEVVIDDIVVAPVLYGSRIPVDPGTHTIRARAPGRAAWSTQVAIEEGEARVMAIPRLRELTRSTPLAAPSSGPAPSCEPPPSDSQRVLGYVSGGAGLASIAAGTVFGLLALKEKDRADVLCPNDRCTTQGLEHNRRAQTHAWVSNGFVGAGLLGLGLGAYWLISAGNDETESLPLAAPATPKTPAVAVDIAPENAGATLHLKGVF